jgi:hypothetical protein
MANTTNYNWETPDDTDLVKDGAAAIRTLGNSIDTTTKALNPETTLGDIAYRSSTSNTNTRLPIGSNGQILGVSAGVPAWINNDQGDITEVQAGVGISIASGTGPIPVITNSSTDLITTAGDLLYGTAADTVARLGIGTAGQVLKVNSGATAPEWGAASGGDFVRITSQSFSAAATVNVNDVFSSTYKNYKIYINLAHSTGAVNFSYRFRVSGSDDTNTNYGYQFISASNTTVSANRANSNNSGTLPDITNINSNIDLTVFSPQKTQLTYIWADGNYGAGTNYIQTWASSFNATTSFTGITFFVGSGSITGTLEVYGIKDA